MKFPLGDIVRALAPKGSTLRRIFDKLKGIVIPVGKHEIALDLNEGAGPARPGESRFDRTPHRPAPPPVRGRRR